MYNDGPYLEEANGTLVATWFNCPRVSEGSCVCGERPPWAIAAIGNRSRAPRDVYCYWKIMLGTPMISSFMFHLSPDNIPGGPNRDRRRALSVVVLGRLGRPLERAGAAVRRDCTRARLVPARRLNGDRKDY
jgi:hypothetical protein